MRDLRGEWCGYQPLVYHHLELKGSATYLWQMRPFHLKWAGYVKSIPLQLMIVNLKYTLNLFHIACPS